MPSNKTNSFTLPNDEFSHHPREGTYYWIGRANSTDEDPRSASGWSIGNTRNRKIGTDSWVTISATTPPLAIGVYGTPK